ncbi:hypothetical protein AA974_03155 [Helicobacter pylori]|nr:hypothetical protein AA974_03155 [Helicobacter pylori]
MHCDPKVVCYCKNKQDTQNTDTKEIERMSVTSHDFGKKLNSINVELSNHDTFVQSLFVQSLLKLGSFLHGETIECFYNNLTNYLPVTLKPWFPPIPAEIEEYRKNTTSDPNYNPFYYRQSSAQNIKINEIAKDLESGKIVGKKIINNALSGVSCCFMDDENLKNLKKLLSQDQINLSNAITKVINQAENPNGINLTSEINLTSAIIVEYHFRDNTFHFIFNVSNNSNFSNGKLRLTIEVPRVALENIKLPETKEIYVNQGYINIFINTLTWAINEGFYIIEGIKQELYHSVGH